MKCWVGINLDGKDRLLLGQIRQKLIFAADAGDFHESVEHELSPGGAEDGVAALWSGAAIVTVVWSNSAGGIWQATKRFQIS